MKSKIEKSSTVALALGLVLAVAASDVSAAGPTEGVYFEAEWAQDIKLNYQLEDEGERCILMADEGADGAFAWNGRPHSRMDVGAARYDVIVPGAGRYTLWAFRYWMDSCGNSVRVAFNNGSFRTCSDAHDELPSRFKRWQWGRLTYRTLPAGPLSLKLGVVEDGPRFDRFALLPQGTRPDDEAARKALPFFADRTAVPFALSVSLPTHVVNPDHSLKLTACIRKLGSPADEGSLSLVGPAGVHLQEPGAAAFKMQEGQALVRVPLDIALPADLPPGEHRLKLMVSGRDGKVCALKSFVVLKPLRWSLLGPLNYDDRLEEKWGNGKTMAVDQAVITSLDGEAVEVAWRPFPYKGYDRYTTMDFERVWGLTRKEVCAYLYTEVRSSITQDVTLLVNNDDRARVWLNGELVYHDSSKTPAIGGLRPVTVQLREGSNQVLARIDQSLKQYVKRPENYWRLRLRFRNANDRNKLVSVAGL